MAILITGGNGLLASEFRKIAPKDTIFVDKQEMDITDINSINACIKKHNEISVIINCAAGRDAEILEEDPEQANQIAVIGPKNLCEAANKIGAILIHISSDYVFDGKKTTPYTEQDKTNGLSVYGRTKSVGEQLVINNANTGVVFRTAWLLSTEGKKSFVNTIASLAQTRPTISVVFDQVGSPTVAADLAKMILEIIPKIKPGTKEIYNLTNEGVASWFDIASIIVQELGLACKVLPIHSSEYPTKAKRPSYSVLDKTKVKTDFNITIRHYLEGLKECLQKIKSR